jgi:hypothetical protein
MKDKLVYYVEVTLHITVALMDEELSVKSVLDNTDFDFVPSEDDRAIISNSKLIEWYVMDFPGLR